MKAKSRVNTLGGRGSVGPKGQLRTSNGITEEGIISAGDGQLNAGPEEAGISFDGFGEDGPEETGISFDGFGEDGPSDMTLYEELLYIVGTSV